MRIDFGNREFFVSPIGFVLGVVVLVVLALVLLKVLGFLAALLRFLLGDETAISRYFARGRERRGLRRADRRPAGARGRQFEAGDEEGRPGGEAACSART